MAAHRDNAHAITLLGRVHLAWPVVGRFKAESLLTRAGQLAPDDPEPFYYLGHVGLRLLGDDGEAISRRGLQRVLELNPRYRDAWVLWGSLYRGPAERRAGVEALSLHAGDPAADLWRAQLLIELEAYADADSLLARLAARAPRDPAPRALLAQARFEAGFDSLGNVAYDEAIGRADTDTAGILWRQVRSIASPREREVWAEAAPGARATLLREFWARRDPRVATAQNERIGEHFRRVREAHRLYGLLHPNSLYHHSRTWRSVVDHPGPVVGPGLAELGRLVRSEPPPRLPDSLPLLPAPTLGEETPNLEDGLDDRGRVYVRYGPPDDRRAWSIDGETWRYAVPGGTLQVSFARRTGAWDLGGDQVVTYFVRGEAQSARYVLATDRPSEPAPFGFAFWGAAFRGPTRWLTSFVIITDRFRVASALFGAAGHRAAFDSGAAGVQRLTAAPGEYVLAVDADSGMQHGRFRGRATLPPFTGEALAVSGVLVAPGATAAGRAAMEAAAPPRLRLPVGAPLRFYAEVYGLPLRRGAHYDISYVFERGGAGGRRVRTTISFRRETTATSATVESLVLNPGRLTAGRYGLHIEVRDPATGARAGSPPLHFELR